MTKNSELVYHTPFNLYGDDVMYYILCCLLLVCSQGLFAVENAVGLYPLGYYADYPGYVPPPGNWVVREDAYHSATHFKGTHVHSSFALNFVGYTTHLKILGGDYAWAFLVPAGRIRVSTPITKYKSELTTTTNAAGVPQQTVTLVPHTHRKSQTAHGVGDIVLFPLRIGWHWDTLHTQLLQGVICPTGHYSKERVANMSLHRWATDTAFGVTWLPHTQTHISWYTGVTVNFTNHKTHYHSGSEWHNDFTIRQSILNPNFQVGCSAYWYYQLTPDSGKGAAYGNFRGRVLGVGPVVSWGFELFGITMELRAHYFKDVYAKNHLKGDTFYLTLYMTKPFE